MLKKVNSLNEIQKIYNLEKMLFPDSFYDIEQLMQMYADKNYNFYVYKNENNVDGYLIVLNLKKELEIIKIGVNPESQGQGIGTKLMNFLKEEHTTIFLEVNHHNTNAINFYKFHGFVEVGRRKNYYPDLGDAIILKFVEEENK